eukprot:CAMPEP_0178537812 /NCGR_PEP_ID=MMETSP0696-20121128/36785_1 /TAXON_ID=265572 /ORGANISM="Extubocellulus spinifer, Strain CCMP396" /LENGTH=33 /DNA_ID= /DNA_START= /DNA_END= /DNA_ORIENTATION=
MSDTTTARSGHGLTMVLQEDDGWVAASDGDIKW